MAECFYSSSESIDFFHGPMSDEIIKILARLYMSVFLIFLGLEA